MVQSSVPAPRLFLPPWVPDSIAVLTSFPRRAPLTHPCFFRQRWGREVGRWGRPSVSHLRRTLQSGARPAAGRRAWTWMRVARLPSPPPSGRGSPLLTLSLPCQGPGLRVPDPGHDRRLRASPHVHHPQVGHRVVSVPLPGTVVSQKPGRVVGSMVPGPSGWW